MANKNKEIPYASFMEAMQPDPAIRDMVDQSLQLFIKRERMDFSSVDPSNSRAMVAGFLRIGIPVSKDTVYPILRGTGTKRALIQDNYLFLQKLILDHTGASHLVVDVIFKDEYDLIADIAITKDFNKNEHVPLSKQSKDPSFNNIHSIIIGLAGGKIDANTFKIYTRDYLVSRVGNAIFSNPEWGSGVSKIKTAKSTQEGNYKNHKRIEMLKKTAIRAFAKERYGSALELIRTIDIQQNELLNKINR